MGWRDWSNFNDVFVNREDRFDEKLPFVNIGGWEDRPFSKPAAQDFDSFQYIFLPITIMENEDQEYAPSFRMPFVDVSRPIMKGSYSAVFPEVIARRQYQKRGESPDANVRKANHSKIVRIEQDYLHYNLRLEDGERSYCIHHDLKPDNILVVLEARGSSVGKWKITDFGLSQFKRSKANGAHGGHDAFEHAPSVRNTLIPSSMTSPKRNPGPFVAPETEKQGQKAVGRESDIWSLGCIWILVMSFMIGGKVGAQEFDRRRGRQRSPNKKSTSYETDYNYRDDGRGGLEVNPDVIAWLDEQKALKSRGDDWLGKGIGLALDMLKIDMKSRPNAKTVQDRLFEVVTSLKSGRQEPLQPVSQTSLVPPQTPQGHDQIQEALVKTMVPLDRKTSWVRTLSGTLGYGDGSASSGPGASNLRSASPVIKEADFVPYPSDILQRPVVESTFVNIKIPDSHIVQTAFSSTNLFVAYLSKTNVYIHSIESLDRSRLWAKGKNKGKVSSETKFQSVRGSGGYQWVSMVLACDLLAVRGSKPDSNSCMVHVYKISMSENEDVQTVLVHSEEVPDLKGVSVSSQGQIAFHFDHYIETYSTKYPESRSKIEIQGHLKSASFTLDGNWLLAWSTKGRSIYAVFCNTGDFGQPTHDSITPRVPQSSYGLHEDMIPFPTIPSFWAYDRKKGQVRIVQGQVSPVQEIFLNQHLAGIMIGKVTTASNAAVLVQKRRKAISIVTLKRDPGGTVRPDEIKELCKIVVEVPDSLGPSCDLALESGDKDGRLIRILIAHNSGLIEKVDFDYGSN
ncbi:MAG: hypothetical protein ASARMPREDX12_004508 [Alectoria sarmentosa]|nr:MAG: hypothetical protein ASARMPREDX12_004508 [Alectoria sarmentosa]